MPTLRVTHTIGNLAADCTKIATTTKPELAKIAKRNVTEGGRLARRIAQGASGPHGKNYYKRITSEMTGPLSGEYGPTGTVVENAVGGGWRHGPANTDLEKSLDVIGPQMAADVRRLADGLFWP